MAKINWKNARKFRDFEEKYEPGTELRNGRVVQARKPDSLSLAARAAEAEKQWIEGRAADAKKQRQRRRKARQKPSPAELHRLKEIRAQLGYSDD